MKIIGHRGARGLASENTLSSLRQALSHHVHMIEFDVRVTLDGVPILHHDKTVDIGSEHIDIANTSLADLRAFSSDITTLQQALDLIDAKASVMIEVKPHEPTPPIVSVLLDYNGKLYKVEQLYLASKNQATLMALHRALPDNPTIVIESWSGVRAHIRARQLHTTTIAMNQLWLWWGFILSMRRHGWKLYAYTLNDPVKAHRWQRYGLAGVITDFPDRFQ